MRTQNFTEALNMNNICHVPYPAPERLIIHQRGAPAKILITLVL